MASVSSLVTVSIADYVSQALPATAALNLIPLGGYSQATQFSCGTLPANVSCAFSPSSVTPNGANPSTVTLTVRTSGVLASRGGNRLLWSVASSAVFGAVLLLPFGKRKRIHGTLAILCLFVLTLSGVGCGGGSNNSQTVATPKASRLTSHPAVPPEARRCHSL
jgi:hypothetical protein